MVLLQHASAGNLPLGLDDTVMTVALRKLIKRILYPLEVMLTCVRWYAGYPLSLRHIKKMMSERVTKECIKTV